MALGFAMRGPSVSTWRSTHRQSWIRAGVSHSRATRIRLREQHCLGAEAVVEVHRGRGNDKTTSILNDQCSRALNRSFVALSSNSAVLSSLTWTIGSTLLPETVMSMSASAVGPLPLRPNRKEEAEPVATLVAEELTGASGVGGTVDQIGFRAAVVVVRGHRPGAAVGCDGPELRPSLEHVDQRGLRGSSSQPDDRGDDLEMKANLRPIFGVFTLPAERHGLLGKTCTHIGTPSAGYCKYAIFLIIFRAAPGLSGPNV